MAMVCVLVYVSGHIPVFMPLFNAALLLHTVNFVNANAQCSYFPELLFKIHSLFAIVCTRSTLIVTAFVSAR